MPWQPISSGTKSSCSEAVQPTPGMDPSGVRKPFLLNHTTGEMPRWCTIIKEGELYCSGAILYLFKTVKRVAGYIAGTLGSGMERIGCTLSRSRTQRPEATMRWCTIKTTKQHGFYGGQRMIAVKVQVEGAQRFGVGTVANGNNIRMRSIRNLVKSTR